jgi:hypothetical protein
VIPGGIIFHVNKLVSNKCMKCRRKKETGGLLGRAPVKVFQNIGKSEKYIGGERLKERGPEPRPLLQATILFHLRGHLMKS